MVENRITKTKPKFRVRQGSRVVDFLIYLTAILLAFVTVYPIIFVFSNSFSEPEMVAAGKVMLFPKGFSLQAYKFVFRSGPMGRAFINSVLYTAGITSLCLLNTMMCGFGLSKKGLLWRKGIVFFIILPMWFSAGLIPAFVNISKMKMYNTLWAIFLPSIVSIYNIILARTFISRLPDSLSEAARIDGAGVFTIFWRIVLPLSKPIMAVLGLYTALAVWNEWFSFLIFLPSKQDLHPLQYFLVKTLLWGSAQQTLKLDQSMMTMEAALERIKLAATMAQLKYAVVVVTTVPIMLVYPFLQKYFVQGALLGSLKE
jgi:putative aldouronate transport system permease protein